MQNSCAFSHKLPITVVRLKTKLELSTNFNFPKKLTPWQFNTVQVEVFTVVEKTALLMPRWLVICYWHIGGLASSTFRVVYKVHVAWENWSHSTGIDQVRWHPWSYFYNAYLWSHDRILPEMHVRSPSSRSTYAPWCMRYSTSTMPWSNWFIVRIS